MQVDQIEDARSQAEMLLLAIKAGDPASELKVRVNDILAALSDPRPEAGTAGEVREALVIVRPVISALIDAQYNVETWGLKGRLAKVDAALRSSHVCEICGGDCSASNPPPSYCPTRDAALAASPATTRGMETGWLVELKGATPSWAIVNPNDYDEHWTADSTSAIRFARKTDAEVFIAWHGWTEAFPSEHIWDDGAPTRRKAEEALAALAPYVDSIICYASTLDEHEGNRVAKLVRDTLADAPVEPKPQTWRGLDDARLQLAINAFYEPCEGTTIDGVRAAILAWEQSR
jgi:hypothetical protein